MIDKEEIDDALFWADLHGIARPEFKTICEWLADGGYVPPASPDDDRVSAELETLLDRLADLGIVIEFTDHLSDRELYSWLMESGHLDGHIGGGSEEANQVYLTYYATDQERACWKEESPNEELPPKQQPRYKRD
ncbi:MAG TPA: hypothetical protein VGA33_10745 [Thermoanaerobaculia bacterium]